MSNIQLVPPKGEVIDSIPDNQNAATSKSAINTQEGSDCEKVRSRKEKIKEKRKVKQLDAPKGKDSSQSRSKSLNRSVERKKRKETASKPPIIRRAPKTAAVVIKCSSDGLTYAEAIQRVKTKVSLPDLKIVGTKIRHTANGGVLIEVPGPDGSEKADALRRKVQEALGDKAVVTRPVIKGELRIVGMDDSITAQEVVEVIAMEGGCLPEDVKVGPIRPMRNGLYTVWIQCPLAAAIRASTGNKIRIGWTIARIELLKARPIQCYRCWEQGHLMSSCKSAIDRSDMCYRCGKTGHSVRSRTSEFNCAICSSQGKDSKHRVGSNLCKPDVGSKSVSKETARSHGDG